MMRTISITSLVVFVVVCGACGAAKPPVTPEPGPVHVTDWPTPAQPLWPASARRVQVIVASSPDGAEAEVWVISQGTNLVAVYRVAAGNYKAAQTRIASANPLFTVILHPGTVPDPVAPPPSGGGQSQSSFQCPTPPCMYVPWTPPTTGPIVPPGSVRLLLRFAEALDGLHQAWVSPATATPGAPR